MIKHDSVFKRYAFIRADKRVFRTGVLSKPVEEIPNLRALLRSWSADPAQGYRLELVIDFALSTSLPTNARYSLDHWREHLERVQPLAEPQTSMRAQLRRLIWRARWHDLRQRAAALGKIK